MAQWHIRQATSADIDALVDFNQAMAQETEGKQLDSKVLHAGVAHLLANPALGFYLVAEQGGEILGSLLVTFEWSDWRNGLFWWIQSVYVVAPKRRQGVYRSLYAEVQQRAKDSLQCCGYRLYVEKQNRIAQQTYESLGMTETHYLMYEATPT